MKKLLLALLGVLIALPALAAVGDTFSYEYEGQKISYKVLSETDKTVETYEYQGNISGTLILPGKVVHNDTEYTLIQISTYSFRDKGQLESVKIPEGVTKIGYAAFQNCRALTSVVLPEGLIEIGACAFNLCYSLVSLALPSSVQTVYGNALQCKKAAVPDGAYVHANQHAEDMMYYDSAEAKVYDGNVISNDGTLLFANVFPGNEYVVNANINKVGKDALKFGTDIRLIVENASRPITFGQGAFNGASLASLYLDRLVLNEKQDLPYSIASVEFGTNINEIYPNTFRGCTGLTTLTIPDNIKTVGENAFLGCVTIGKVLPLAAKAPALDANAFDDYTYRTAMLTLPDDADLLSYRDGATNWPLFLSMTDSGLGGERFEYSGLTYRILGEDAAEVVKADNYAGLTEVEIPSQITREVTEPDGDNGPTAVTHRYRVVGIAPNAFEGLTDLTSVKLSESVEVIGQDAFKGCAALNAIGLGKGLKRIGASAFGDCTRLTKVETASDSLEYIADGAFSGCTAMTTVKPGSGLKSIGKNAFSGCNKLTTFDFAALKKLEYIGDMAFQGCQRLKTLQFAPSLDYIGDYAFERNMFVTSLKFDEGSSLRHIGAHAFDGATRIKELVMPDSLEYLGDNAFDAARSIKTVELPANGRLFVGDSAFAACQGLEKVVSRGNLPGKGLGAKAFTGCINLQYADLKFDEIGDSAFVDNTALTRIRLEGNGRLHSAALSGCSALVSATLNMDTISSSITPGCSALDSLDLSGNVRVIETRAFNSPSRQFKAVKFGDKLEFIGSGAIYALSEGCDEIVFPSAPQDDPVIVVEASNFGGGKIPKRFILGNRMKSFMSNIRASEEIDLGTTVETLGGEISSSNKLNLNIPASVLGHVYLRNDFNKVRIEYAPTELEMWSQKPSSYNRIVQIDTLITERQLMASNLTSVYSFPHIKNLIFPDNSDLKIDFKPSGWGWFGSVYVGSCVRSLNQFRTNRITFAEGVEQLESVGGSYEEIRYPGSLKMITKFFVPEETKSIMFAEGTEDLVIQNKISQFRVNDSYKYYNDKNVASVYIGRTIKGIDHLFEKATGLKKVIIGNDADSIHAPVTLIPAGMFKGCTALENAILSDSIKSIGAEAFDGCSSLKVVSFPEGIEELGEYAYRGCSSLDRIVSRTLTPVDNVTVFDDGIEQNVPLYYPAEAEDEYLFSTTWTLFYDYDNLLPHEDNVVKDVIVEVPEETDFDNMDEGFSSPIEQLVNTTVELVGMELLPEETPARKAPRRAAADGTSPAYGTETPIYWFSPNPEIASIDENNVLTIHKNEPAEIWAIALDGSDVKAVVGINRYLLGDVNGDKVLNTADVNALVGHIVAPEGSTIRLKVADMNADGAINTADVNILINSILEK